MKMNNCFVLAVMLIGMPFFSCQGDGFSELGEQKKVELAHELVEELLEQEKDRVFFDLSKFQPFYNKTKKGQPEAFLQSLKNALFLKAVNAGSGKEILEFILEEGASAAATDRYGRTALHVVALVEEENLRERLMPILLEHLYRQPLKKDQRGNTPLHSAATLGRTYFIRWLLKNFLPEKEIINMKNEAGRTALMEAASHKGYDIVRDFAAREADVNAFDDAGKTALHLAVEADDVDMVKQLLLLPSVKKGERAGVLPMLDEQRGTPVHYAVMLGNPKMVEALLSKEAVWLKNMSDEKKNNALKRLVNQASDEKQTPLDLAFDSKSEMRFRSKEYRKMNEIIKILKAKGARRTRKSFQERFGSFFKSK